MCSCVSSRFLCEFPLFGLYYRLLILIPRLLAPSITDCDRISEKQLFVSVTQSQDFRSSLIKFQPNLRLFIVNYTFSFTHFQKRNTTVKLHVRFSPYIVGELTINLLTGFYCSIFTVFYHSFHSNFFRAFTFSLLYYY